MDEMAFRVARKHAGRLRMIGLALLSLLPALVLLLAPSAWTAILVAALMHLTGALACRWLFFAEAEHVVGLYYGHGSG